jgi:kynureninase
MSSSFHRKPIVINDAWVTANVRPLFRRALSRPGVYLANHSLGRPLDQTADDIREGLDLWYSAMDAAWDEGGWLDEAGRFRDGLARLLGLPSGQCVVPKSSAGQGLRTVLNSLPQDRRIRVVATKQKVDHVDFILKTYAYQGRADVTWIGPDAEDGPVKFVSNLAQGIPQSTDLVVFSHVAFETGRVAKHARATIEAAHRVGAVVVLDVYHSAGAIPVDLVSLDADFAIGGCYKYLRGGPGAGFLAIHPRHVEAPLGRTLDTGWFAKKGTFGYGRSDAPEWKAGGDGWLESTPPVLVPYQARAGLQLALQTGAASLRADSLDRQARLREALRRAGHDPFEPSDPEEYGAYSLVPHPDAKAAARHLAALGVTVDARGPFVRFGPDLLNTDADFAAAAEALARVG